MKFAKSQNYISLHWRIEIFETERPFLSFF